MKKISKVVVVLIVALFVGSIGIVFYFSKTPEYALMNILQDVNESGMDGLRLHLTGNAKEAVDAIMTVTESELVNSIMGLLNEEDYASVLKSEISNIQWDVQEILKSKSSATVILDFDYEGKLVGTIEFSMCRNDGEWKIHDIELPKVDEINW